jgi:hypothetical protein
VICQDPRAYCCDGESLEKRTTPEDPEYSHVAAVHPKARANIARVGGRPARIIKLTGPVPLATYFTAPWNIWPLISIGSVAVAAQTIQQASEMYAMQAPKVFQPRLVMKHNVNGLECVCLDSDSPSATPLASGLPSSSSQWHAAREATTKVADWPSRPRCVSYTRATKGQSGSRIANRLRSCRPIPR